MSEKKEPLAGEWWQKANKIRGVEKPRVYVLGTSPDGKTVGMRRWLPGELHDGDSDFFYGTLDGIEGMEHLPECTGWEWQPETFPQWYVSDAAHSSHVAFYVRMTRNSFYKAYSDGKESNLIMWDEVNDGFVADGKWKQITQEEAKSRVKKPEPIESPDDWVTQDRVSDRPGIDQWRWVYGGKSEGDWRDSRSDSDIYFKHGYVDAAMDRFEVRCRRKDLPPTPQETPKRHHVRLFVSWTSCRVYAASSKVDSKDKQLHFDGAGFYEEDSK